MPDVTQLKVIEDALVGIDQLLRGAPAGPAVRELRVRQAVLSRVVSGWAHVPPHDAQIAAMLECVIDLRTKVVRACPKPPKDASAMAHRTTRPPPRRNASMRTTRPPPAPRPSDGPPSSRRH